MPLLSVARAINLYSSFTAAFIYLMAFSSNEACRGMNRERLKTVLSSLGPWYMPPVYYTRNQWFLDYTKLFEIFYSRHRWSGSGGFWFLATVHWWRIQPGLSGWESWRLAFRISAQTHAVQYRIKTKTLTNRNYLLTVFEHWLSLRKIYLYLDLIEHET